MYDQVYDMHLGRNPDVLEFGAHAGLVPFLDRLTSPDGHVVEIGCGTGLLAIELGRRGRRVVGLDVSEVALEVARRRAQGVRTVQFEKTEEWTHRELLAELKRAGFASIRSPIRHRTGRELPLVPGWVFALTERLARATTKSRRARSVLGIDSCELVAKRS